MTAITGDTGDHARFLLTPPSVSSIIRFVSPQKRTLTKRLRGTLCLHRFTWAFFLNRFSGPLAVSDFIECLSLRCFVSQEEILAFSAIYHAATNNPVRPHNGSERLTGTFTLSHLDGSPSSNPTPIWDTLG